MNFAEERAAIEGRFANLFSDAPVAYENVQDSAALAAAKAAGRAWVRLAIMNTEGRTAAIGGDGDVLDEQLGRVWVQVFVKEGTGTAAARVLVDSAAAAFRHAKFSGLRFYTPSIKSVGTDGSGYYQFNVSVPFRRFAL